jgi:hypothetical protein
VTSDVSFFTQCREKHLSQKTLYELVDVWMAEKELKPTSARTTVSSESLSIEEESIRSLYREVDPNKVKGC